MEKADLILYVADGSVPLNESDEEIIDLIRDRKTIVLLNKTDLETVVTEEVICVPGWARIRYSISAREEKGIDQLEEVLKDLFSGRRFPLTTRYASPTCGRSSCWRRPGGP